MILAVPVAEFCGIDSVVYGHFGSAPSFALVDTETLVVEEAGNADKVHEHGACQPMKALAGRAVDGVVVAGIGMGALLGLRRAGIHVYRTGAATVGEVAAAMRAGALEEMSEAHTCAGHAHGGGCGGHA